MRIFHGQLRLAAVAACLGSDPRSHRCLGRKGQGLFYDVRCWQCHGTVGREQRRARKLAPSPMPYDGVANSCGPPTVRCRHIGKAVTPGMMICRTSMPTCNRPGGADYKTITAAQDESGTQNRSGPGLRPGRCYRATNSPSS